MKIDWNTKENKLFLDSVLLLKNRKEAGAFFRDLMTENEIIGFGKRLEAVQLLSLKTPYLKVTEKTGLSSTTVARISKWLKGSFGGYRLILSRLSNTHHHNSQNLGKDSL